MVLPRRRRDAARPPPRAAFVGRLLPSPSLLMGQEGQEERLKACTRRKRSEQRGLKPEAAQTLSTYCRCCRVCRKRQPFFDADCQKMATRSGVRQNRQLVVTRSTRDRQPSVAWGCRLPYLQYTTCAVHLSSHTSLCV